MTVIIHFIFRRNFDAGYRPFAVFNNSQHDYGQIIQILKHSHGTLLMKRRISEEYAVRGIVKWHCFHRSQRFYLIINTKMNTQRMEHRRHSDNTFYKAPKILSKA